MKRLTDNWFTYIDSFPHSIQLILYSVTGSVFLFIFLMRFRKFRDIIFSFLEKNLNFTFRTKITSHELFFSQSKYDNIIRKINLNSEAKTFSIKTILQCKSQNVISEIKSIFKNGKWKKFNDVKLLDFYIDAINKTVDKYADIIKGKHIKKYGESKGIKLFNYVYVNGFEPIHNARTDEVITKLKDVTESKFLSQTGKTAMFLSFVKSALDEAVIDAEKTFKKFNGEPDRIINE